MLQVNRHDQVTFLFAPPLDQVGGIMHGFSTRRADHNNFTLGPTASPNPLVQLNRIRFMAAIGAPGWAIMKLKQVHSPIVHVIEDTRAATDPLEGDAAVTSFRGIAVGVQTADCVPILLADARGRAVGAIHAGWRGTASRIVERTVETLWKTYGVSPEDLWAAIGPHIGVCCYEVGDEVVDAIADAEAFERTEGRAKAHLNLAAANRSQLLQLGVPAKQIVVSSLCTRCRPDLFYSYRREGTTAGRMLSVIGLVP